MSSSLFFFIWTFLASWLPEPIVLSPSQTGSGRYINDSIKVYYTLDTLTGQQALDLIRKGEMPEHNDRWKAGSHLKNYGFWILFEVVNQVESEELYYINFAFNRTDVLNLYEVDKSDNQVRLLYQTGDIFPFHERPVDYRNFVFPIPLKGGQTKTILLNAEKRMTVDRFPIMVFSAAGFERARTIENIQFGLFFGFFALISLLAFIIGISVRKGVFVFYGLYAILIGIYLFSSLGLTFQYILPNAPKFNYYNLVIFGSWAIVFFSIYSILYFKPFANTIILDRIQLGVTYGLIAIVNIPSGLLLIDWPVLESFLIDHYMVVLTGNYICVLLIFLLVFFRVFYYWRWSGQMGKLFLSGMIFSFLGICYSVSVDNGLFPDFLFDDNSFSILLGFFLEFCFLTFAMVIVLRKSLLTRINFKDDIKYRELHHRIKNNLQVISSLMNMQALHQGDASIKQIVEDGQKRIQAISLIHQKIYLQDDVSTINVKEYLEALLSEISSFYNQERAVRLKTDIQNFDFTIETMTSIGIIVNELVINSYKYAFEGVQDPEISVELKQSGEECILQVKDNGKGILEDFNLNQAKSFGLRLVTMLTRQLKAQIRIDHRNGMEYNFVFSRK